MRVAIIAPPWLALPVKGYGGIEVVLEGLITELQKMGVSVEVFGSLERKMEGVITHGIYTEDQFYNIARPMYDTLPVMAAHMQFALDTIKEDGGFDVIHDHNCYFGPELLAWATSDMSLPPVVYTHHGPPFTNESTLAQGIPDNGPFWNQLANHPGRMYIVGISDTLLKPAPAKLRSHILPTVYNAVMTEKFPFVQKKENYFITLARFTHDKGQHIAARLCAEKGLELRMAGIVSGIESKEQLELELANPNSSFDSSEGFKYYKEQVLPYMIQSKKITYVGNISGNDKMKFISESKGLLFSIDWEEPFGMVVIEALACGTPVIAMNKGAMPEIIEHGVNGFLANTEEEFAEYMDRIDEIDPAKCRKSVEDKFSAKTMAASYVDRYNQAIKLNGKDIS
jgi:glycosyltransferase involved in cell wall biosynthesis